MIIARNHTGHRVGECHQHAVLTDDQVRAMRYDREQHGMSLRALAKAYGCGLSTARDICDYATRYTARPIVAPDPSRYIITGEKSC